MSDTHTPITFGTDPEFMVFDEHENKIVNAIPVIKHDKHNPVDLKDGFFFYSDNVLSELRMPPTQSKAGFVDSLREALGRAQEFLGVRYSLLARASHTYDILELGPKPKVMTGKLPVEWEIGCNPSFDAYERKEKIPDPFKDGLRSGSFHLHLGNANFEKDEGKMLRVDSKEHGVKLMDLFVGIPSIIFNQDDTSLARRMLYGKAGEFRPTPYGIEWRVLDNYPLRSPKLVELVLDLTDHAMRCLQDDVEQDVIDATNFKLVRTAIDTNNRTLAHMAMQRSGLPDDLVKRVEDAAKLGFKELSDEWELA